MKSPDDKPGLLFISTMPVETSIENDPGRWRELANRFRVGVIGFTEEGWSVRRRHGCRFYGIPRMGPPWCRGLLYYVLAPLLTAWMAIRWSLPFWIAQGPFEAGAVVAVRLILGPLRGDRLAIEAHGDWIGTFLDLRDPPLPTLTEKLLQTSSRFVLARADALRAVSASTEEQLRTFAPRTPRVRFPAYMDLTPFLDAATETSTAPDPPVILYAGALTRLKGIDVLLEALGPVRENLPKVRLKLAGEGERREEFEGLADRLGLAGTVEFLGRVSREELARHMARSTVLVLPSRREGYGRVLVESMAAGTPVVATRSGGPEELLEASEGGWLVPPGDVESLSDVLVEALTDESLRSEKSQSGREFVLRERPHEQFFEGYERLVRTLAST